jgi:threonine aldolase
MKKVIELRSDTFTKPTAGMLDAMFSATVGDDVFEEDEACNELQKYCADLFGYEAGLFCTSGTMANQIALNCWVRPGEEIICDAVSHIHLYEGGGIAANTGAAVHLLHGDLGRITAGQVQDSVKPDNPHYPKSRLVSLENTVNRGGGSCYEIEEIEKIRQVCLNHGMNLHLDGARLFNAMLKTKTEPKDYGRLFDSISICLSKGLGAPIGSVLLGSKVFIHQAMRVRKRWGGGWRQAGYLAAAGLFALKNQVDRLADDHLRASKIADIIRERPEVTEVLPVETNIVIFYIDPAWGNSGKWVGLAAGAGIFCSPYGNDAVRMVTHLDFTEEDLNNFSEKICSF